MWRSQCSVSPTDRIQTRCHVPRNRFHGATFDIQSYSRSPRPRLNPLPVPTLQRTRSSVTSTCPCIVASSASIRTVPMTGYPAALAPARGERTPSIPFGTAETPPSVRPPCSNPAGAAPDRSGRLPPSLTRQVRRAGGIPPPEASRPVRHSRTGIHPDTRGARIMCDAGNVPKRTFFGSTPNPNRTAAGPVPALSPSSKPLASYPQLPRTVRSSSAFGLRTANGNSR